MVELQTILSLSEWCVKLLDYRNKRTKAYFEEVIKPCNSAAKDVRDDLVSIYNDIEKALQNNQTLSQIESLILTQREKYLSTRDALRAQLRHIPPDQLTKFERGITSLLEWQNTHALMRLHMDVRMTLDYMGKMSNRGNVAAVEAKRIELFKSIADARRAAEEAWREIADGYALYVANYVRHPA